MAFGVIAEQLIIIIIIIIGYEDFVLKLFISVYNGSLLNKFIYMY